MRRKLRINISPCPNDTFMFDAMLNGRIDCEGLEFEHSFADIEVLNSSVLGGAEDDALNNPDVSKISYAVLPEIIEDYLVLNSGSALGRGNGPLLVSSGQIDIDDPQLKIAMPGFHTTAYMLMRRLFPQLENYSPLLFSEIAERVSSGEFGAGVLIHEGRFTYRDRGLILITDLGVEWESRSDMPLPLGGIVVSRKLPREVQQSVDRVLRRSVEFAMQNRDASAEFVRDNAQEMSSCVTRSHIELFVNQHSVDLGEEGRGAVRELTQLSGNDIFL